MLYNSSGSCSTGSNLIVVIAVTQSLCSEAHHKGSGQIGRYGHKHRGSILLILVVEVVLVVLLVTVR